MNNQISSTRISSIGVFSKIVKENNRKWVHLTGKIEELNRHLAAGQHTAGIEQKISMYEIDLSKASFVLVVFAAMSAEAYIYDYAARNLGDAFVKDHLDKIDTVSKWILIPKLITGRELPRRSHWQAPLKKLVQTRNSITHYKSWDPLSQPTSKTWGKLSKFSDDIHQAAGQSVALLGLLADTISENDPEETPWVHTYFS